MFRALNSPLSRQSGPDNYSHFQQQRMCLLGDNTRHFHNRQARELHNSACLPSQILQPVQVAPATTFLCPCLRRRPGRSRRGGGIHRAMEMNVREKSDDTNTFILASSQRKWARICWQTIGGSSHHQGFETGRLWGCAATIMQWLCSMFCLEIQILTN